MEPAWRLNGTRCTSGLAVQLPTGRDALAEFISPRKLSVNSAMNPILSENTIFY
jgi:hypothetical protein